MADDVRSCEIEIIDARIEEAKRLRLGSALRAAVMERLTWAGDNHELYTAEQMAYWAECLEKAAEMVDSAAVSAGIYRDLAKICFAGGMDAQGIEYAKESIRRNPDSPSRDILEAEIREHEKKV